MTHGIGTEIKGQSNLAVASENIKNVLAGLNNVMSRLSTIDEHLTGPKPQCGKPVDEQTKTETSGVLPKLLRNTREADDLVNVAKEILSQIEEAVL